MVPLGILSPGTVSSTLSYTLLPGGTTRDTAEGLGSEVSACCCSIRRHSPCLIPTLHHFVAWQAPDHCLIAVSPCKRLVVLVFGRAAQFLTVGGMR